MSRPTAQETWEHWYERGPAEDAYQGYVEDGLVPASRYDRNGCAVLSTLQPFEDWAQGPQGEAAFELWIWNESDPYR